MDNSTRRKFIILSTILFICVVLLAIPYSQGWRWNQETGTFQKVGGLYILSHPPEASIYLNGKHQTNRSGILDKGTLLSNLNPGEYTVHLSQVGFQDWQRKVIVEPERVSELKTAVLVPKVSSNTQIISTDTDRFWLIGKEIISQNSSGTISIAGRTENLGKLMLEPNPGDRFLFLKNSTGTPVLYDLAGNTFVRLATKVQNHFTARENQLLAAIPDQTSSNRIYALENRSLSILDTTAGTYLPVSTSTSKNAFQSAAVNESYLAESLENIFSSSSSTVRIIQLGNNKQTNLEFGSRVLRMDWAWNNQLLILDKNRSLWLWRVGRDTPAILADKVSALDLAPDRAHLAVLIDGKLTVWSLSDNGTYADFPLRGNGEITGLSWYRDGHHLFLHYPDKISFLEINDSHLENSTDIVNTSEGVYDGDSNRLYYLDGGNVKFIQFPNG